MMVTMRTLASLAFTAALVAAAVSTTGADHKAFLGRWNLTGTGTDSNAIYWLEIKEENGQLTGMFLNRGGSPVKLASVEVKDDELVITTAAPEGRPGQTFRVKSKGDRLEGSTTVGERTLEFTGARPPSWPAANANATHTYGKPVELFDGKSLDTWNLQVADRPSGWTIVDGAMTNEAKANNLVSKQTFKDFKIQAEYRIESGSNSGIYLRGRYEVQIQDDAGKALDSLRMGGVYGFIAPSVDAARPPGTWQTLDVELAGRFVTVVLNGTTIIDNQEIPGITCGAIDSNEGAAGPIMLQGDHGAIEFRNLTIAPAR